MGILADKAFRRSLQAMCLAAVVVCVSGCRFNVAVLRTLLGDPQVTSGFENRLSVDLTDSPKRLLVLCQASHSITSQEASLPIDLTSGITTRLRAEGINVVDADEVTDWIDENGSWDDLSSVGEEFDADYIAVIRLQGISYNEPNSTNLYRAYATGAMTVFEMVDTGAESKRAVERYSSNVNETFPNTYPISADQSSEAMFRKKTLDHLSTILARHFHSYHPRETIN